MDPKFNFPASPGTPLFAVSPERANRQPFPQSPSLPSDLANLRDPFVIAHSRTSSDVQGKVAQFNNLSKEAIQRRKDNEAALKRAVLGREEAESETRRLKEENRVLRKEIEEGRGRERKVAERIEGVMSELQQSNEMHVRAQALYDKEIRRARKEAFKSSSALVKLQEELKSARNKFTLMREEVEAQRRKVEAQEQETFDAQYRLVGLQEEVDKLCHQKTTVEEERDALKTNLKEEEIARIAAEGRIALPKSKEGDEFSSPKKRRSLTRRDSLKENVDPELSEGYDMLTEVRDELKLERRIRQKAEDQIHFMKMECQFQCCSCRIAERQGTEYHHDEGQSKDRIHKFAITEESQTATQTSDPFFEPVLTPTRKLSPQLSDSEPLIKFSPTTGTFYKTPSPPKGNNTIQTPLSPQPPKDILTASSPTQPSNPTTPLPQHHPSTPHLPTLSTPFHRPLPLPPTTTKATATAQTHTTITKTITIPLATTPIAIPAPLPVSIPYSPSSTMTREQALEQIRVRRGRARSIAAGQGTPRRVMVVGMERRDVSAPAGRSGF